MTKEQIVCSQVTRWREAGSAALQIALTPLAVSASQPVNCSRETLPGAAVSSRQRSARMRLSSKLHASPLSRQ